MNKQELIDIIIEELSIVLEKRKKRIVKHERARGNEECGCNVRK